jgi:cation transport ATPase
MQTRTGRSLKPNCGTPMLAKLPILSTGMSTKGHQDHHAHMAADFRKRFWISLVLTLPILALSPLLQTLVGLREAVRFSGDVYVLFGFSSAVFWYGGWPFLKGLTTELKSLKPAARRHLLVHEEEEDIGA